MELTPPTAVLSDGTDSNMSLLLDTSAINQPSLNSLRIISCMDGQQ